MKLDSLLTLLFLGIITIAITAVLMPAQGRTRGSYKPAKCKSLMKQIGTSVAMYFSDGFELNYPQNPDALEIDEFILQSKKSSTYLELNLNSPFYFFPHDSSKFTGKQNAPLATNWEPIKYRKKEFLFVVWEDGHVSTVSYQEQAKLINRTYFGSITKLYRDLTFQTNPLDL